MGLGSIRRSVFLPSALFVLIVLTSLYYFLPSEAYDYAGTYSSSWIPNDDIQEAHAVANSTLGFHKIIALTRGTPWRVEGLNAAANLTGLVIDTSEQPPVADEELARFRASAEDPLGEGSAAAWLSHLHLLKRIGEEGLGSVLVIEDDIDFDVRIKEEMRQVAAGMRELLAASKPASHASKRQYSPNLYEPASDGQPLADQPMEDHSDDGHQLAGENEGSPYGEGWDVIWLGHCGENVGAPIPEPGQFVRNDRIWMWRDSSVVPKDDYTGFAHNAVVMLPSGTRAALWSIGPVCTFAYAVTAESIPKILEKAGRGGGAQAFDVRLGQLCSHGELRCISVSPEVFHEYTPPHSDDIITSEVNAVNGQGENAQPGEILKLGMGTTVNIVRSARCASMYQQQCFPGRQDPV